MILDGACALSMVFHYLNLPRVCHYLGIPESGIRHLNMPVLGLCGYLRVFMPGSTSRFEDLVPPSAYQYRKVFVPAISLRM